jgi:hypothetical protein
MNTAITKYVISAALDARSSLWYLDLDAHDPGIFHDVRGALSAYNRVLVILMLSDGRWRAAKQSGALAVWRKNQLFLEGCGEQA